MRQHDILKPQNFLKRDNQTLLNKNTNIFFWDCQKTYVSKEVDGKKLKFYIIFSF